MPEAFQDKAHQRQRLLILKWLQPVLLILRSGQWPRLEGRTAPWLRTWAFPRRGKVGDSPEGALQNKAPPLPIHAKESETPMPFQGLGPQTLPFFKALGFHQTKAWFEENRAIYETDVKAPLGDLVEELSAELQRRKIPLHGDRKKAIFRLHRDTRFAKDKSPYKTNAGFVLNRDGTKNTGGMLYVHIDPAGCFTAAGWYRPEPPTLTAIRAGIAQKPRAFFAMEAALEAKKLGLSNDYTLKRTPRGYEAVTDDTLLTAIRRTALLTSRPLKDADIGKPKLLEQVADFAEDALPLLQFGWKATG